MNVLVVSSKYPPEYAGSALRAHSTYKRLAHKYGVEFDVVAGSVTTNETRTYVHDGVKVRVIANKYSWRMDVNSGDDIVGRTAKRALNKLLWQRSYWSEAGPMLAYLLRNSSRYDAIHVFGNVAVTSAAIWFAKITRRPVIIELVNLVDNPHQYEPKLVSLLFGDRLPKGALLVCLSQALKDACLNHGYSEDQLWCRPNPVDESRFVYEADGRALHRNGLFPAIEDNDVLVLYLAKFIPRKNQLFLVDVMTQLPDHFKLVLAGPLVDAGPLAKRDRDYYASVQEAVKERGLEDRVQLTPQFVSDPQEYMKAADVFVMPTVQEALGTPFLEALACGVPVVANNIPGVFDQWIEPGVNGYISDLDPAQWAEKITQATRIPEENRRQASEKVLRAASTDVIDRGYWEALQRVAA